MQKKIMTSRKGGVRLTSSPFMVFVLVFRVFAPREKPIIGKLLFWGGGGGGRGGCWENDSAFGCESL